MKIISKNYLRLFSFLSEKGLNENRYQAWQAHTQLVTMLSTGLLMWAYAILAFLKIDHPLPGIIGIAMSTLHLLSPILLRWPGNIHLAAHTLIGAGIIHQGTFAFYTGGFNSNILIWFGILPMLAGIILGRKGVIPWALITLITSGGFLYAMVMGYTFPRAIDSEGWILAQAFMVFGWIILSTVLIYVFILLMEHNDKLRGQKNAQIRTLVRVLCHDISNPLTTIKNRLKLIQMRLKDDETQSDIHKVDRPIEAIQAIIEQIREYEAIESGKKELKVESVSVNEAISFVLDIFHEKIQQKNLNLNLSLSKEDPLIVANKSTLQSQIFANILSNAIKFSDPGSTIDIVTKIDHKNEDTLLIQIRDYGEGIPENLLEILFDPTKKTTRLGTAGERGTGFGMPIVKSYVEKLGGVVQVFSKAREKGSGDSGTTFELYFKTINLES